MYDTPNDESWTEENSSSTLPSASYTSHTSSTAYQSIHHRYIQPTSLPIYPRYSSTSLSIHQQPIPLSKRHIHRQYTSNAGTLFDGSNNIFYSAGCENNRSINEFYGIHSNTYGFNSAMPVILPIHQPSHVIDRLTDKSIDKSLDTQISHQSVSTSFHSSNQKECQSDRQIDNQIECQTLRQFSANGGVDKEKESCIDANIDPLQLNLLQLCLPPTLPRQFVRLPVSFRSRQYDVINYEDSANWIDETLSADKISDSTVKDKLKDSTSSKK